MGGKALKCFGCERCLEDAEFRVQCECGLEVVASSDRVTGAKLYHSGVIVHGAVRGVARERQVDRFQGLFVFAILVIDPGEGVSLEDIMGKFVLLSEAHGLDDVAIVVREEEGHARVIVKAGGLARGMERFHLLIVFLSLCHLPFHGMQIAEANQGVVVGNMGQQQFIVLDREIDLTSGFRDLSGSEQDMWVAGFFF